MSVDPKLLKNVIVTDCGSTTTKALLFQKGQSGWRQTYRGEAPTTVEEPVADVTVGALNAFTEVEELSQRRLIKPGYVSCQAPPFIPGTAIEGVDLYLSTSSAGGGLQMMVAGVVKQMTTESAQRAALGAGAIVLDSISADDGREEHERIEKIRHLRPDIVLLTGGVDGGSRNHVIEVAEILLAASPRPRFGDTLKLPVIYAGNSDAAEEVRSILERVAQMTVVANVRPELDRENLGPAREAIHEFFLTHVMSHSPGYAKLLSWTPVPVMPTPAAVGDIVQRYAGQTGKRILCVDIGGATTDVFSVFYDRSNKSVFNRTVSANLGMSYSIANVLVEAGVDNIGRWLPYELSDTELRDRLRNKMIRPTSIPQTLDDLWLEQAVCREALRLSLEHHRSLAVGLSGVQQSRGIADIFSQRQSRYELVDLMKLDLVIGSGGVLSHAPERLSAALMLLDGFGLKGVTQVAVDSIFMLPHLGVFCSVHPEAADEIFIKDCLVNVAHTIVPIYPPDSKARDLVELTFNGTNLGTLAIGEVKNLTQVANTSGELICRPLERSIDIGAGPGEIWRGEVSIGCCGLVVDGRNRPIVFNPSRTGRIAVQRGILESLGIAGK